MWASFRPTEVGLNFGLDKNTNSNVGQLHYSLGLGGSWFNSEIEGSVMIRPVLRANNKSVVWNAVADGCCFFAAPALRVYPNPVSGAVLPGGSAGRCRMATLERLRQADSIRSLASARGCTRVICQGCPLGSMC